MIHGRHPFAGVMLTLTAALAGCSANTPAPTAPPADIHKTVMILPGPNVQERAQTALIQAKPGDIVEFGEGTFDFTMGLSLYKNNVTIRGKGMEKTILSFKKQDAGKEGLLVARGGFLIEDLTVEDTKGDAIKVNDADGVIMRRVQARWTGGSKETNGGYGLYPVQCKNVLIEDCVAIAASDAGIYVGQSQNIIVRRCRAERNVAGIEIENSTDADVYENMATDNAGGLLVFDLPGLQVKNGKRVRVFNNKVIANNHANFAPKGNLVASVAPGTGLMVMATDQVEVFRNTIKNNGSYGLTVWSFLVTERPFDAKEYDPYPEGISVHDNTFAGNGADPKGERASLLAGLLGTPLPDMLYDGIHNPAKLSAGKLSPERGVFFKNNGTATFANLHWDKLNPSDPAASKKQVERDPKPYEGTPSPLAEISLPGVR